MALVRQEDKETIIYGWLKHLNSSNKKCVCFSSGTEEFSFIAGTKEKVHSCVLKENLLKEDFILFQVIGKIKPNETKEVLLVFELDEYEKCFK